LRDLRKKPIKRVDKPAPMVLKDSKKEIGSLKKAAKGGDLLGSVVKKRRKKMRKHKHRKLLARTRHQRRKGK
jgi:hypothetical protein